MNRTIDVHTHAPGQMWIGTYPSSKENPWRPLGCNTFVLSVQEPAERKQSRVKRKFFRSRSRKGRTPDVSPSPTSPRSPSGVIDRMSGSDALVLDREGRGETLYPLGLVSIDLQTVALGKQQAVTAMHMLKATADAQGMFTDGAAAVGAVCVDTVDTKLKLTSDLTTIAHQARLKHRDVLHRIMRCVVDGDGTGHGTTYQIRYGCWFLNPITARVSCKKDL